MDDEIWWKWHGPKSGRVFCFQIYCLQSKPCTLKAINARHALECIHNSLFVFPDYRRLFKDQSSAFMKSDFPHDKNHIYDSKHLGLPIVADTRLSKLSLMYRINRLKRRWRINYCVARKAYLDFPTPLSPMIRSLKLITSPLFALSIVYLRRHEPNRRQIGWINIHERVMPAVGMRQRIMSTLPEKKSEV